MAVKLVALKENLKLVDIEDAKNQEHSSYYEGVVLINSLDSIVGKKLEKKEKGLYAIKY